MKSLIAAICVAGALVGTAAVASPEPFCIARDAWTCNGAVGIEMLEKLDRKQSIGPFEKQDRLGGSIPGTVASADEARSQIIRGAGCTQHPWLHNPDGKGGPFLVNNRITVMYVDTKFVLFCQRYSGGKDGQAPEEPKVLFSCSHALISDVRDLSWRPVARERLAKAAAVTTMADVVELTFCPADYP